MPYIPKTKITIDNKLLIVYPFVHTALLKNNQITKYNPYLFRYIVRMIFNVFEVM